MYWRAAYWRLRALTAAMKLDLLLFGHVESGPFFALLERVHVDKGSHGVTEATVAESTPGRPE